MDKKISVFTTKKIIVALESITTIVHDFEGEWQFLGDREVRMDDLLMVSLEQILELDSSIEKALEMKKGYQADRLSNSEWQFSKIED